MSGYFVVKSVGLKGRTVFLRRGFSELRRISYRYGAMKKRPLFVAIDFSKHKGRYVAIVRRRIVASGRDAQQVWREAKRKLPDAQPELMKVSKGETLV
jgi:hypothetical protein